MWCTIKAKVCFFRMPFLILTCFNHEKFFFCLMFLKQLNLFVFYDMRQPGSKINFLPCHHCQMIFRIDHPYKYIYMYVCVCVCVYHIFYRQGLPIHIYIYIYIYIYILTVMMQNIGLVYKNIIHTRTYIYVCVILYFFYRQGLYFAS